MQYGNMKPNSKNYSQFRLWAETRPHEVGVASNPGSARRGECVLGSCTHRPSSHGSWDLSRRVRSERPGLLPELAPRLCLRWPASLQGRRIDRWLQLKRREKFSSL